MARVEAEAQDGTEARMRSNGTKHHNTTAAANAADSVADAALAESRPFASVENQQALPLQLSAFETAQLLQP